MQKLETKNSESGTLYFFTVNDSNCDLIGIESLYTACGWNQTGERSPKQIDAALVRSLAWVVVKAFDAQVVGFGRLIGDGIFVTQLVDVLVHERHRRQGIGSQIVCKLITDYSHVPLMLINGSGIADFYARFGFNGSLDSVHYRAPKLSTSVSHRS